jgi:class 3 adenylate cyclase
MPEREASVREENRIAYRMGINIGDIIVESDDIYGDGVNIVAGWATAQRGKLPGLSGG